MAENKNAETEIAIEVVDKEKRIKPIEKASQILESFGPFQIYCVILFCPVIIFFGMTIFIPIFLNIVPDHQCQQSISDNTIIKEVSVWNNSGKLFSSKNMDSQCNSFVVNDIGGTDSPAFDKILLVQPCQQWMYNLTDGKTVVSQFDLVCKSAQKRPLTINAFMLGLVIGYPLVGLLANGFGRKKCSLIAVVGSTIFHIIIAFSPNFWFYIFAAFCNGFFASGQYFSIIWAQELMFPSKKESVALFTSKKKFVVNTCLSSMFAVGGAASSLVAYLVQDWSKVYIVCGVGYFLSLLPLFFIPESLTFLIIKNKTEETVKILKSICRKNKLDIASDDIFKDITDISEKPPLDSKQTRAIERQVWGNAKLRKRLIVNCLLSVFFSLSSYTLIYNTANLGGNVYIINVIGCILDIVSNTTLYAMLHKMKRKQTLVSLSLAIGIFCILSPILKPVNTIAPIAFALIGRFFCNAAFVSIISVTGEFFSTSMRPYSVFAVVMFGQIGSLFSPNLVHTGVMCDWSIPFYVIGGLGFFSILLILLLPETYNRSLPTTLQEALMLKDPELLLIGKPVIKAENPKNTEKAISLNSSISES